MSLTNFPCGGPVRPGGTRTAWGLLSAPRNARYADAFSAAGELPWAGSPAFTPPTITVPPDPMLLAAIRAMA
jgi:hypothetical protein